ncbi:MAG: sigma-70 family RNA polymerase sigma factor [Clostridia bacterium]|nr:sigma-70 family RNA polymerase sigma factor [Clostridia bacterium]
MMEETKSDNLTLLKRASEGDREAMDRLIVSNLGLVKSIANRFRERGVEYEDLVQIGTIGMIKAVSSFDFSYGTAFSTYAVPMIIGEIKRYLRDDGIIKISRTLKRDGINLMKQKEAYLREHGCEARISELAELCGMSVEDAAAALEAITPVKSFAELCGEDEGSTLEAVIADKNDEITAKIDNIALREAVASLPKLWRQIVFLRYVKEYSQQKTGELLGLTQVKVSREEKKIIAGLRAML